MQSRSIAWSAAPLAVLLAACTGAIESRHEAGGAGPGEPSRTPNAPRLPTTGGPSPEVIASACARFPAAERQRPPRASMRRLSWAEIANSLTDLFPGVALGEAEEWADPARVPDRVESSLAISETFHRTYHPALASFTQSAAPAAIAAQCKDGSKSCLEPVLLRTAQLAWRSRLADTERAFLTGKLAAFQTALGAESGFANALRLVLGSPRFLFLLEPGSLAADVAGAGAHEAHGDRLAGMLAAALWASVPDERLLATAAAGKLRAGDALASEVDRMLADPKARRGVETFFSAWLRHNLVLKAVKDDALFPGFDEALRAELMADTGKTLLALFFDEGQPPDALVTSPLGFPGPRTVAALGWGSQKVAAGRAELSAVGRSGIATHPSILAVTSKAHATSIVNRGRFVAERLACAHIPEPPPDVDGDLDKIEAMAGRKLSGREVAELHAREPSCAGCHRFLDPFGIVLEGFDAIGRLRTQDAGQPVNTGVRIEGALGLKGEFAGPRDLLKALADTGEVGRCFTTNLAAFVMPAELSEAQSCVLEQVARPEGGRKPSMKDITRQVLLSPLFLQRAVASN